MNSSQHEDTMTDPIQRHNGMLLSHSRIGFCKYETVIMVCLWRRDRPIWIYNGRYDTNIFPSALADE